MAAEAKQIVKPYHQTNRFSLYDGDCRSVLPIFAECSVDSIVCDPPYELGFMGKGWDRSGIAYDVSVWRACLRVLKPGGHLLAFGGSRTYHRLACAIEDAGFEIRDDIDFWYDANPIFAQFYDSLTDEQKETLHASAGASHLSYIYGSGFPKSLNVSKNLRESGDVCICNGNSKALPEHGLRSLSDRDIPPPLYAQNQSWEVLQSSVSQQGASAHRPTRPESEAARLEESGMEGRRNLFSEARELQADQVREMPAGVFADGPEGWLRDGTPPDHGSMDRASSEQNGSSSSRRSRSAEQQARQPSTLSEQPRSQTGRAWPLCGRCGKPVVPEGLGSALKPAHEPIVVARKPLTGTLIQNVLQYGTGGLNIDGCRIQTSANDDIHAKNPHTRNQAAGWAIGKRHDDLTPYDPTLGRWPANVIHDGSDEVLGGFPESHGDSPNRGPRHNGEFKSVAKGRDLPHLTTGHADNGSAARFFKSLSFQEDEVVFHRAKAIMYAWNSDLALTVDNHSSLSNQHAASVLRRAAIAASRGAKLLSGWTELSTSATPMELKRLGETLITAILFTERNASLAPPLERPIDNGCLVKIAEAQKQTGIITITISHWRSNGSVDPVTLTLTSLNSEVGAKDSSASRFTYCAKTTQEDRNEGCEDLPHRVADDVHKRPRTELDDPRRHGVTPRQNNHPTVKPTDLMRYLCRLITPPGGLVLDPFCGSGSTGKAAMLEGLQFIGIELSADYCQLAQRRIEAATKQGLLFT